MKIYFDMRVFKCYLVLSLLHLSCGSRGERCTGCSKIPIPRTQDEYDCSNCKLEQIPKFPSSATRIDLSYNNISTIGSRDLSDMSNLRELYLGSNVLTVINRDSLLDLKSLRILVLYRNRLNASSLESLRCLQSLLQLDIRRNLYDRFPESIPFLWKLNVLHIDIFRNFAFNDRFLSLKNLNEIYFAPRGKVTLKNNSFEGIRNSPIKELSIKLPYQVVGEVGIDFLLPFRFLKKLTLNIGGRFDIKKILSVLHGMRNRKLDFLDVSGNNWDIFRHHDLKVHDLANLFTICVKELHLRRDNILHFPFHLALTYTSRNFSNCLEKLIIPNNNILWTVSEAVGLFYYPSLKYIDVSYPKFLNKQKSQGIHPQKQFIFPKLHHLNVTVYCPKNLEYVDVSGIDLSRGSFTPSLLELYTPFVNAPNMTTLKAKDTSMTLCNFDVIVQRSLLVLDMSGWNCSNFYPKVLQRHHDLIFLNASRSELGNYINKRSVSQTMFSRLSKLETIDLSVNSIKYLSQHFFIDQSNSLKHVYLSFNALHEIPKAFIVLKRVESIDLRYNKFEYLSKSDISILSYLRNTTFDFGGNKFDCSCKYIESLVWMNELNNLRQNMICRDESNMTFFLNNIHYFQLQCVSAFWLSFALTSFVILIVIILVVTIGYRNKSFVMYLIIQARRLVKQNKMESHSNQYKYDAFVSYSHLDYDWVTGPLYTYLNNELGLDVCLHQKDFIPGKPIAEEILRCVECSKKSIFIVTRNFLVSKWSLFEMDIARHHVLQSDSDTLIVILKEDIPVHEMPMLLRKIWWRIVCLKYPKGENQLEIDLFNRKLSEIFQN